MKMMGRVHYRLSGLWTYTTRWDITGFRQSARGCAGGFALILRSGPANLNNGDKADSGQKSGFAAMPS
jgi:hypothetical protein